MTMEQALLLAISSLSLVVVTLWNITRVYERECREDRKRLWATVDALLDSSCKVSACHLREKISKSQITALAERRSTLEGS